MLIFDGYAYATEQEQQIRAQVHALTERGVQLRIAAILFVEDSGSRLYTRLKSEAAARVGIAYETHQFSMSDPYEIVKETIDQLNRDTTVTGIIIQKPWRETWMKAQSDNTSSSDGREEYANWWESLVSQLALHKDVDGLHPDTLRAIERGNWKDTGNVLPATAQAVLNIVRHRFGEQSGADHSYGIPEKSKIVIIGKSDIVGKPLYFELKNSGTEIEMIGSKELAERVQAGLGLQDADIVISATGRRDLVTGDMLKIGVTLIDVGEPRPDVAVATLQDKPSFLTPVPGGVGPLTVQCLLQNCVCLGMWYNHSS